jgi:hypothetical protein
MSVTPAGLVPLTCLLALAVLPGASLALGFVNQKNAMAATVASPKYNSVRLLILNSFTRK